MNVISTLKNLDLDMLKHSIQNDVHLLNATYFGRRFEF